MILDYKYLECSSPTPSKPSQKISGLCTVFFYIVNIFLHYTIKITTTFLNLVNHCIKKPFVNVIRKSTLHNSQIVDLIFSYKISSLLPVWFQPKKYKWITKTMHARFKININYIQLCSYKWWHKLVYTLFILMCY